MADDDRWVGRYVLREQLGAGGFATVYRAHDPVLDREVALKVLHPHLSRDAATRERFIREGRSLARVRHPNIVQVFDAGEADGAAYLAMELIEGRSLASIAEERGTLTLAEVVTVAEQVGAALASVHARGLIHRDIKPANIIIEGSSVQTGRAVLLDLGVARAVDATAVTATGLLIGTPGFMAPEQVEPDMAVTPLVDVYQLGATVYMLLTGRPPFEGEATRVLYAIVHRPPPDLAQLRPDLPPAVAAVIGSALAKDPTLRPPNTVAFAERLRAAGTGVGASAWGIPAQRASPSTVAALQAQPTQASPWQPRTSPGWDLPPRSARRPLWPWLALAGGVVGAGAIAAAVFLARGDGDGRQAVVVTTGPAVTTASPTAVTSPTVTATVARSATASATPTVARTATPSPAAARTPVATPAPDVAALLRATMEGRGFVPDGNVVQVRATDAGGALAVQKGICKDSANGRCQQLFIYLDERFLGTDTLKTSAGITDLKALGAGRFSATYANYAQNDPGCCPSLPPVTVTYTWDGSRLTPDQTPPGH